jgi:hypothetical protein
MAKQLDAACNRQSPSNSWARGSGGRLLPSDLINPLFERDFPAEVNERADYNDLQQQTHSLRVWQRAPRTIKSIYLIGTRGLITSIFAP